MTISSTTRIAGPYIGNGTASVFGFSFKVFAAADLDVVRLNTSNGAEAVLVLNSDYSVTLNGDQNSNPGGSITLLAGALATGFTLTITSDIANLQPTDLTNQGGFYPEVITDSFDRSTIQIQQMSQDVGRSLKAPLSDGTPDMELPTAAQRANSFLAFDSNGVPYVVPSSGTGAPVGSTSAALVSYTQGGVGAITTNVQEKLRETVSVKDFGAVGDGVTNDGAAILAACSAAISVGKSVYVPSGTYIVNPLVLDFTFASSPNGSFAIFGDGPTSIIKAADNSVAGNNLRLINLRPSINMEQIAVSDLTIDNNARGSSPPPSPFDYEQSHALRFAAAAGTTTKLLKYTNVTIKDPVADGMNNQGNGTLASWVIADCSEIDRTRTRSSIQQSILAQNLLIDNFTGKRIECEALGASGPGNIILTNSVIDILDIGGNDQDNPQNCLFYCSNVLVSESFVATACTLFMDNCDFILSSTGRINSVYSESRISQSTIRCPYNASTGAITTMLMFIDDPSANTFGINIDTCNFLINQSGSLSPAPTGFMLGCLTAIPIANIENAKWCVRDCTFDPRAESSVDCYRNGTWLLQDNVYACRASASRIAAIRYAPTNGTTYGSSVTVINGDFSKCVGYGFAVSDVATVSTCPLVLGGSHIGNSAAEITNWTTSGAVANNNHIYSTRVVTATALPSSGMSGDTVRLAVNTVPSGAPIEYVATATSETAPNFRMSAQKGFDRNTTANRPAVSGAKDTGTMYLDTTLDADGKPIWWNGTAWIDATGATV